MLDKKSTVLFAQADELLFQTNENSESSLGFSLLRQLLLDLGCVVTCSTKFPLSDQLINVQVLVIGIHVYGRQSIDIETVHKFVTQGGGVLLLTDALAVSGLDPDLNKIASLAGVRFAEYLNTQPTSLQVFDPHYMTANLKKVRIDKGLAALNEIAEGVQSLIFTNATRQMVAACNKVDSGRLVVMGNVDWLTDSLINKADNKILVTNVFQWLLQHNAIEIESVSVPKTVIWGQTANVSLQLYNDSFSMRPEVTCLLESDQDAIISEPARKSRSIPPKTTSFMQWTVQPQLLGKQKMRLSILVQDGESLFFDRLPDINCLAPGYFTLEIKNDAGQPQTQFETGERFSVKGIFHENVNARPQFYELELLFSDGLVELPGHDLGDGIGQWYMRAMTVGEHELLLRLVQTGQSLPALITISLSLKDRLSEIRVAYEYPLNAEITARLKHVHERFAENSVQAQTFEILLPEEFIDRAYTRELATWLRGVLASARREQWPNRELLEIVMTYISPVYVVNQGAFVPFDPKLASHLAWLHYDERRYLEYNLLSSEESEDINIKQNVASYLLHEKYGHGFFYAQTRLGQQLALLQGQPLHRKVIQLIEDSSIIVNEGFAAWLELTLLKQLDRDVRQAFYPRHFLLIEEGTGLEQRAVPGSFFETFRPYFDSRYREGYEYLDSINEQFNLRCVVSMFLLSADIDLGIHLDEQGNLVADETMIRYRLLEAQTDRWRSHFRLRKIAELLRYHREYAKALVKRRYCPLECQQAKCPLEDFIAEKFDWRI